MAVPKNPLRVLAEALQATSVLKKYAKVSLGTIEQARQGGPGRITLELTDGDYDAPKDRRALADVEQTIVAHCWGKDDDDAWDLHSRLLQGLEEQAAAGNGGTYWSRGPGITWDKSPDTTTQGVGLLVTFIARVAVDRPVGGTGQVDAVSFTQGS
jgi:hypothetical protein